MRQQVGKSKPWRRTVALSTFVGLTIGLLWSGAVLASSTQPSDEGIGVDPVSVRMLAVGPDAGNVNWSLIQYVSDTGTCLDVEGELNGERASFGGCDSDPDAVRAPMVGGLVLDGERLAVAFGVLTSPGANVRVLLIDGRTVAAQVQDAAWVVSIPVDDIEAATFERADILDEQGIVIDSVPVVPMSSGDTAFSVGGS
jgi:hypothetical protein